ncbi:DNA mismatch endonuclease Vsr [Pseudomonas syringae pv. pisi str. PP1]|uniref:very short patch repair endonuclease n=1 Tax=Pseudomonas syringae TaxID=317 RepID=UPI00046751BF|nr:very short patch repair endonuclease [Pseudomonas syringae]AZG87692.1 DNA mismatch endonuclease Vsr [Pseudomonas syringae pv. pisi str. PP1]UZS61277.1 very short patch repair endonuclease [Pseudomonas syringae]
MDIVDTATRSKMMGNIKAKNTRPEIIVRKYLHKNGYRFRIHRRDLPGNPDIVLPKLRTCIFVHGCFWHRHKGCRYASTPQSRADFWSEKFEKTMIRDEKARLALQALSWNVLIIWECELRAGGKGLEMLLHKLQTTKGSSAKPQDEA